MDDTFFAHLSGKIINNKYKITEMIGQGGMGTVYQANVLGGYNIVAIKFMQDETSAIAEKRFLREMELAAKLQHKNIVTTFDAGTFQGKMYMVMEYVKGTSLTSYCKNPNISLDEKLHLIYKIADGLAYAHNKNIIHRDIKPDNIIVDQNGEPKIMDFGLAKIVATKKYDLTKTGNVVGTPQYMSPEQITGEKRGINEQTDIYSLGTILYELIVQRPMIESAIIPQIVYVIRHGKYSSLDKEIPETPKMIVQIWQKSVAPQKLRYKKMENMVADLKLYLQKMQFSLTQRVQYSLLTQEKNILRSSILVIFLLLFFASLFFWRKELGLKTEEKEFISTYTNSQIKMVYNLIDYGFYGDAKTQLAELRKQNQNQNQGQNHDLYRVTGLISDYFELQIDYAQGKFDNDILESKDLWNKKFNLSEPEKEIAKKVDFNDIEERVALLKIKAFYQQKMDIANNIRVNEYKSIIANSGNIKIQNEELLLQIMCAYENKRYQECISIYENNEMLLLDKSEEEKYKVLLYVGHSYLRLHKQDKTLLANAKNTFAQIKNPSLADRYSYLMGVNSCLLFEENYLENLSAADIKMLRENIEVCCTLRPNDSAAYAMLAQTYMVEDPHTAYYLLEKASVIDNEMESLEGLLELAMRAPHYQDEAIWLNIMTLSAKKSYTKPDLPGSFIEKMHSRYKPYYLEYKKYPKGDDDIAKWCSFLDKESIRKNAIQTLSRIGYLQDITQIKYYVIQSSKQLNIIDNIINTVHQNKQKLFLYFLADFYLYNSKEAEQELSKYMDIMEKLLQEKYNGTLLDPKQNIYEKDEQVLLYFMIAHFFMKMKIFEPVIMEQYSVNSDISLACSAALDKAIFMPDINHLLEDKIVIQTVPQAFLYAEIMAKNNQKLVDFPYFKFKDSLPTKQKLEAKIDIFNKLSNYSDEIQCAFSAIAWTNAIEEKSFKAGEILKMRLYQSNALLQEYASFYYWQGTAMTKALHQESTDATIHYINEEIDLLKSSTVSDKIKLGLLNCGYLLTTGNSSEVLRDKSNGYKKKILQSLKKIIIEAQSDVVRLNAVYALTNIGAYEKEYIEILLSENINHVLKSCMYVYGSYSSLKRAFKKEQGSLDSEEKQKRIYDINNLFLRIIESNTTDDVFKGIVYIFSAAIDAHHINYIEKTNNKYLQANMIMSISGTNLVPPEYTMMIQLIKALNQNFKYPDKKGLREVAEKYCTSSDYQIRMSAWAAKAFLSSTPTEIKSIVDIANTKKDGDIAVSSGVAWGLYRQIYNEVNTRNQLEHLQFIKFQPQYDLFSEELCKITSKYMINRYCNIYDEAIALENNSFYRSRYLYEKALIAKIINNTDEATKAIQKALEEIESYKGKIPDKWLIYELAKIDIINTDKFETTFATLQRMIESTNEYYLLRKIEKVLVNQKFLYFSMQDTKKILDDQSRNTLEDWKLLHQEVLKKLLLKIYKINVTGADEQVYLYKQIDEIHRKLAQYSSPGSKMKKFHESCSEFVTEVLRSYN